MSQIPVLFISHGAPDLPLRPSATRDLPIRLGQQLEKPTAILVISAHWNTTDPIVSAAAQPETIHDFSGFPVAYKRGSTLESTILYKSGLFSFLVKGEDSGGRDAMIEYQAKPGNEPAPYMNQWEHETYYVIEGVMEFY